MQTNNPLPLTPNPLNKVSMSPHLHDKTSVKSVMWHVVIALSPAWAASVYYFGINALYLTIYGIIAAVLTEALILFIRKKPIAITDGSAVITGLLVSFNVHAGVPWWIPVAGSVFAIGIGKHAFGGLGHNIFNPALLGRAFLVASWPAYMTGNWVHTIQGSINGINIDALKGLPEQLSSQISSATPLAVSKIIRDPATAELLLAEGTHTPVDISNILTSFPTQMNLFWGNIGGCIGEVSSFCILLGALYLLIKNIIEWRIPFFYIMTVGIITYIFGGAAEFSMTSFTVPIFHILSGGLLLGAFFMATDMVTSPITKKGRILFGIGCGVLTATIRLVGGYPEGVSYSILLMNLFVPLIDKFFVHRPFGEVKK